MGRKLWPGKITFWTAATKRLLLETRRDQVRAALAREAAVFAERVGTPENVEAIRAFYEKRKPDFAKLARS